MIEVSDFGECLNFEQSGFEEQDDFYKSRFGVEFIHRYSFTSDTGKSLQRKDVDAILISREGLPVLVSEKKHSKNDLNKLIIEPYSKYECGEYGWTIKNQSQIINVFTPDYVHEIMAKPLVDFTVAKLMPLIDDDIKALFESGEKSCKVTKTIDGINVYMVIFITRTKKYKTGEYYTSVGVTIRYKDLEKFGIKNRVFQK